jgi:predicted DNA-binding transcriptional regulator AlpA
MQGSKLLRPKTVSLINNLLQPWIKEGVIARIEANFIISNLKNLVKRNELQPIIPPKLLNQQQVADMLCLGLSNFKKLEKAGVFPFKRKLLGGSVRYCNLDVINFVKATQEDIDAEDGIEELPEVEA